MFFISFFSRFINRFAPCVLFRRALTSIYSYFHMHVHQRSGCNRRFSGCLQQNMAERVMLSLHGQLVLDIRPRC